jgi:hypothetical protein
LHIAFAIPASELTRWEAWLGENRIDIEEKRTWDLGGQGIYSWDAASRSFAPTDINGETAQDKDSDCACDVENG